MDNKWSEFQCGSCRRGLTSWGRECPYCNQGWVYIRPSGHLFAYPGGPALGKTGSDQYMRATPVEAVNEPT